MFLLISIKLLLMTPASFVDLPEFQQQEQRQQRQQQNHHHRRRQRRNHQPKNDHNEENRLREFVFRSLMDNLPRVTAFPSPTALPPNNDGDHQNHNVEAIPLDEVLIYPTSHTDDNVPSIVDGVEEVVLSLLQQLQLEQQGRDDAKTDSALRIVLHKVNNSTLQPPQPHCSGTSFAYKLIQERLQTIPDNGGPSVQVQYLPGEWKDKNMNSLNEVERLIQFLHEQKDHPEYQNIQALIVVSTPFHLPRSFLSALSSSVSKRNNTSLPSVANGHNPPFLKVFAKAAKPRESSYWNQVVPHSQGILVASRHELIDSELKRIHKYQQKGDLISLQHALQLLQERDEPIPTRTR